MRKEKEEAVNSIIALFQTISDEHYNSRHILTEVSNILKWIRDNGINGLKIGGHAKIKENPPFLPIEKTSGWYPYRRILKPGTVGKVVDIYWSDTGPSFTVAFIEDGELKSSFLTERDESCKCDCPHSTKSIVEYSVDKTEQKELHFMLGLKSIEATDESITLFPIEPEHFDWIQKRIQEGTARIKK